MFNEPPLAHPAEVGGVVTTWRPPQSVDDGDREQDDADAGDEQHMGVPPLSDRRIWILTRGKRTVCALVHSAIDCRSLHLKHACLNQTFHYKAHEVAVV